VPVGDNGNSLKIHSDVGFVEVSCLIYLFCGESEPFFFDNVSSENRGLGAYLISPDFFFETKLLYGFKKIFFYSALFITRKQQVTTLLF